MKMAVSAVALFLARVAGAAASPIPLMPEALETELALSAAPPHLRADAAVLLLGERGYVEARKGSNGFTCLVGRSQPKAVAPMCYDVEGTRTVVPLIIDEAAMRARGESEEAIQRATEEGFRTEKYKAPERPGIADMMSPVQELAGPDGVVRTFVPHLMFYAPNLTRTSVASAGAAFINSPAPHGMIIVPLGKEEQKAIQAEQEAMVKAVREFLSHEPGGFSSRAVQHRPHAGADRRSRHGRLPVPARPDERRRRPEPGGSSGDSRRRGVTPPPFGPTRYPLVIVNMSVWESLEALHQYVYKSPHVGPLRD